VSLASSFYVRRLLTMRRGTVTKRTRSNSQSTIVRVSYEV
jgi:hypothetical protein